MQIGGPAAQPEKYTKEEHMSQKAKTRCSEPNESPDVANKATGLKAQNRHWAIARLVERLRTPEVLDRTYRARLFAFGHEREMPKA